MKRGKGISFSIFVIVLVWLDLMLLVWYHCGLSQECECEILMSKGWLRWLWLILPNSILLFACHATNYMLLLSDDYRLFCGDLGNGVNDDVLSKAFSRFPSFNMARVVRDKRTGNSKGYGFISFANPTDLLKEMNGKYVGNRSIKLRKSNWKERTDFEALERQKDRLVCGYKLEGMKHGQKKPKLPKKSCAA